MTRKTIRLGSTFSKLFNNEVGYTTRLTCPQVSLIAAQQNKGGTTLLYRTTSVGTLVNFKGNLYDFNLDGAGKIYDIRIGFDPYSFRVDKVIPQDKWVTWSYTLFVSEMRSFLSDHSLAGVESKEHISEMVRTYQNSIQQIEKSAATICK